VGHGRGVAVLAAAQSEFDVFEYTPIQVKQSIVGYGRAEKTQVQQMVKQYLIFRLSLSRMMWRTHWLWRYVMPIPIK